MLITHKVAVDEDAVGVVRFGRVPSEMGNGEVEIREG